MAPSIEALLTDYDFDPTLLQRVSARKHPQALAIVEPNASWPQHFTQLRDRIQSALGPLALTITHIGSTSIPSLPAKAVIDIDIDLTVPDATDEAAYAAALEAAGFQFLTREPHWYEHRFFCAYEPAANLHVWGPDAPEPLRHLVFRERLMARAFREMGYVGGDVPEKP